MFIALLCILIKTFYNTEKVPFKYLVAFLKTWYVGVISKNCIVMADSQNLLNYYRHVRCMFCLKVCPVTDPESVFLDEG